MAKDVNRKTTIPIDSVPQIIKWLIENCTLDELIFMKSLSEDRIKFGKLTSIFNRLTEYNVWTLFLDNQIRDPVELVAMRASKRGEVAGLKAFQAACKVAAEELKRRGEVGE